MWASHGLVRFCVRPYSVIGPELQVRLQASQKFFFSKPIRRLEPIERPAEEATSDSVFSIFFSDVRLRVFHILWRTPCFPYDSVFSIFFSDVRLRVFHMTPCFPYFYDVRLRVFHMTPCFPYFYDVRLRVFHMTPCFPYFSLTSDSVFSI